MLTFSVKCTMKINKIILQGFITCDIYGTSGLGVRDPGFKIGTTHHDLSASFCLLPFIILFFKKIQLKKIKKTKTKQQNTHIGG